MGSRDSDSSFSGDENEASAHSGSSSNLDKNSKKSDSPSAEDSVNNEPKSNNSSGSSEEGNSSGSGSSSGYANGVSSSHSSESLNFSGDTAKNEPTRSKYPSKKKDSQGYRQYHSEIEKKRRNKINSMIDELSELVPMCRGVSHKLDKLTVLKMTVQHMKMLTQKSAAEGICSPFKPPCISEDEMKYLLEQAGDGFLFVLSSDRAQILYISDAVWEIMHYSPSELIGRSFYDIVHSRDIPVIKDQLTPFASLPSINSARAARVGKPGHSRPEVGCMTGSRRSFFCRFRTLWKQGQDTADASSFTLINKSKSKLGVQYGSDTKSYIVVHCSGFLKSWQTADTPVFGVDDDVGLSTFCCFIAIGRKVEILPGKKVTKTEMVHDLKPLPTQYTSHHSADAKILYVDSRVVSISGFLPQDLIGQSEYDYIHQDDIPALADTFKKVLVRKDRRKVVSSIYRLRAKSGFMIPMRTVAFSLFNPYSKELEYVVHENCIVPNMKPHNCNQSPQQLDITASQGNQEQGGDVVEQSPGSRTGIKRPHVASIISFVPPTSSASGDVISLSMVPPKRKATSRPLITLGIDTDVAMEGQDELDRLPTTPILLSPVTASLVRKGAISIDFAAVTQALAGTQDEGKIISLTKFCSKSGRKGTDSDVLQDYYISPVLEGLDQPGRLSSLTSSVGDSGSDGAMDSDPMLSTCAKTPPSKGSDIQRSSYVTSSHSGDTDARDYYSQLLQLLPFHDEVTLTSYDRNGGANSSSGIDSGRNSENGSDNGSENRLLTITQSDGSISKNSQNASTGVPRPRQRIRLSASARNSDSGRWQASQAKNVTLVEVQDDGSPDCDGSGNASNNGSGYSSNGSTPSGYLSSESGDVQSRNRCNRNAEEDELKNYTKTMALKDREQINLSYVYNSNRHSSGHGNRYSGNGSSDSGDNPRDFTSLSASSFTSMVRESLEEHGLRASMETQSYNDIATMLNLPRGDRSDRD